MKRKVWGASPVFFILTGAMLLMACASWFWNLTLFYAELFLTAASAAAVLAATGRFKAYVRLAVKSARDVLTGDRYHDMKDFSLPAVIVGVQGDILWTNDSFFHTVGGGRECRGGNILKYIYPHTAEQIITAGGTDVSVGSRRFTVYGIRTEDGTLLFFVDTTDYREISRKYQDSKPVTVLACFDNYEELSRNTSGSEETRMVSDVEEALIRWSQKMGGFLKRLNNSRYFILTDEAHIRAETEKKFPVLDTVRSIKAGDRLTATISVGIARGAGTLVEADAWARTALEMALGRGGDQVAVRKENDTYEFFGGLSKGVEKRDKVRTRVFAATISDDIKGSDSVFIMGHKYSDLDCIGAAVGMWNAASKTLHKAAHIVVNREQCMAMPLISEIRKVYPDEKIFISPQEALMMVTAKSMLVVVDTHSQDFVESPELLDAVSRVVVIDHHRMMVRHISNALVFYHEPYASSASEMVAELIQYIGDGELSEAEAEALLAGIMLDTKSFVLKTGVRTFEAAAYLRRKGADTVRVKRMFSDSLEAYKAKHRIVSNAEIFGSIAVASAENEYPEIRISSAQAADELLSIQGVDASFVVFPADGTVNISARSLGEVNVQLIMEDLGGGGHLTMAGAQMNGLTVAQARSRLIEAIRNHIEDYGSEKV